MSEWNLISSDVKFENPKRRGVVYMRCNAPSPPKKSPEIARFQDFFSFFSLFVVRRVVIDPYFDPYRSMELDLMRVMGRVWERKSELDDGAEFCWQNWLDMVKHIWYEVTRRSAHGGGWLPHSRGSVNLFLFAFLGFEGGDANVAWQMPAALGSVLPILHGYSCNY